MYPRTLGDSRVAHVLSWNTENSAPFSKLAVVASKWGKKQPSPCFQSRPTSTVKSERLHKRHKRWCLVSPAAGPCLISARAKTLGPHAPAPRAPAPQWHQVHQRFLEPWNAQSSGARDNLSFVAEQRQIGALGSPGQGGFSRASDYRQREDVAPSNSLDHMPSWLPINPQKIFLKNTQLPHLHRHPLLWAHKQILTQEMYKMYPKQTHGAKSINSIQNRQIWHLLPVGLSLLSEITPPQKNKYSCDKLWETGAFFWGTDLGSLKLFFKKKKALV